MIRDEIIDERLWPTPTGSLQRGQSADALKKALNPHLQGTEAANAPSGATSVTIPTLRSSARSGVQRSHGGMRRT